MFCWHDSSRCIKRLDTTALFIWHIFYLFILIPVYFMCIYADEKSFGGKCRREAVY